MDSASNKTITIKQELRGLTTGPLEVNYKETTDGLPYYECSINGQKVQLRKDDQWELMWGDLPQDHLEQLGAAIDKQITTV
ncbi:MAG: hypothetical protein V4594_20465 [Bacteroidota bacterium]